MAIIDVIQKKLNVQPDGIPTVVRLSQNENGRELVFDVENCEIPAGSTVTISGTKPDGNVYSLVGSITDNTVTFAEDIQMTAVGGQWDAKVVIVNGGNTVATGRVRMIIDPDTVDPDAVPSSSQLEGLVAQAQEYAEYAKGAAYGAPYVASTVSQMTDHDHVYVYTGSETGYVAGNWYYWSGSAWTSGGTYNSEGVATDKTLAVGDMPADAKVTGDRLTDLKSDLQTRVAVKQVSFTVPANTNHSSSLDKLYIAIDAGMPYVVVTHGRAAVFGFLQDGTSIGRIPQYGFATQNIRAIGIYYENPTASAVKIDATVIVGGVASLINLAAKDIADEILLQKYEGKSTFTFYGSFALGGLNTDGSLLLTQPFRVSSTSHITIDMSITVSVKAGYAVGYIPFVNGTAGAWSGWFTSDFYIPKGTEFVLQIRANPEVNTATANLKAYREAIQWTSAENEEGFDTYVDNSRHIKDGSGTPLTLLHFSDVHADKAALERILQGAEKLGNQIDEKICTGDMTGNTYGQITSWWNPSVLTCIGNHDTASYSGGAYNWTALSMANRDAYYIAPFESGWGITHTSGTSYYYKDYSTQKVRLIVMDVMLYTDNGAEATAQTAWLENLLADAITNSLHVIIAIHAPHGGATAKVCSFSRYNQSAMGTIGQCNTPQTVIDTVAAKITAGLKFVGYLVGHTHQDNIWDAESDGKQLMYCITCAAVTQTAQWISSDQNRSTSEDAYNIVTIDTKNTLVKIVRGGGADIDDHMRTRKAICFNYSTGTMVGEVL